MQVLVALSYSGSGTSAPSATGTHELMLAILAYYTPENNANLYREAESWLALALEEGE